MKLWMWCAIIAPSLMPAQQIIAQQIIAQQMSAQQSQQTSAWKQVKWSTWQSWGEQPDGTYLNPVIPADYSDLDCIQVGDDYYAISSTFQFSPGMTVLHSRDLVNWELCGNAVTDLKQIGPELDYTRMNRYGRGIWAGTLRYNNGRFYIFFGTPDEGYFMTSAPKAEGPWAPLTTLLAEPGWDDCSAIWDEKGDAYFVGTCFREKYKTYLFKMSPDAKRIDRKSAVLVNSGGGREANKLIRHGNWYYLVFSESLGKGRYVVAKRARHIMGPYKEEKQLAQASHESHEPNQGGIIQGPDHQWYFFTQHGWGDWGGRLASLLPVTWINDWPIIGEVQPDGMGRMQWQSKMPTADKAMAADMMTTSSNQTVAPKPHILQNDDFDATTLAPQWQWNYQPRTDMSSLTDRPGWMRMKAFRPLQHDVLLKVGNILTQRSYQTKENEVTVKFDLQGMTDGQKAGLCHFAQKSAALGVVRQGGKTLVEYRQNDRLETGAEIPSRYLWLRSAWQLDGKSQFSYSVDGDVFIPFGAPYQLSWGVYRGDRIGIYTYNNQAEAGYIDVDYFHYRMK